MKKLLLLTMFPILFAVKGLAGCWIHMTEGSNGCTVTHTFTNDYNIHVHDNMTWEGIPDDDGQGTLTLKSKTIAMDDYNQIVSFTKDILDRMTGRGVELKKTDSSDKNGIAISKSREPVYYVRIMYPCETFEVTYGNY